MSARGLIFGLSCGLTRAIVGLCLACTVPLCSAGAADSLLSEESTHINSRYLLQGPAGQAITEQDFPGRFQIITFGYTYCPDICPTTLAEMAEILKQLGESAALTQAIFITLDPERDTPQHLSTYTAFFDARILPLSGSPALVKRAAQNYKIRYSKVVTAQNDPAHYAIDHSSGIFLLSPKGNFIQKFGYGRPVSEIVNVIRQLLERDRKPTE